MIPSLWLDRPYYSLDAYCKNRYGTKVYKIALDAGLTCPNRDGTLGTGGCIFCSAGGSGDFAVKPMNSVAKQLEEGQAMFGKKKTGNSFIAYFQAYTNTYGDPAYLEEIYEEALKQPQIVGISIATRPDCLPPVVLDILTSLKAKYPTKDIWCYTGYLFDSELLTQSRATTAVTKDMLSLIDVLVDGKFVEELKNISLAFKGSENQRIIDVQNSLKQNKVIILKDYE